MIDQAIRRTVALDGPVSYVDFGGSGDGILLLHGLGGASENWLSVGPLLAPRGRVVAMDLRGHGRTPLDEGQTARVDDDRELVERFIEEVFAGPVTLVGNSMGGMISLLHCVERPDQVSALVLLDAVVPWPEGTEGDPVVASLFATYMQEGAGEDLLRQSAAALGPEGMVDRTLEICCVDARLVDPDVRAALVQLRVEQQDMPWISDAFLQAARSLLELNMRPDLYNEIIRAVTVPGLIVQGAADRLVPVAAARALADLKQDWQLEVYEDVGHVPHLEAPDRFATTVLEWLERQQSTQEVKA